MRQELRKLKDLWDKFQYILTKRQKQLGIGILALTLIGAVTEMLGVSIMGPFVQALIAPQELLDNRYLKPVLEWFEVDTPEKLLTFMGVGIAAVYIVKNLYLVLLSYCRIKYSTKVQRELSVLMMQSYMRRGYLFFAQVNTGELLRGVLEDVRSVYQIMYNTFRIFAELFTTMVIVLFVFTTDIMMAASVVVLAFLCFLIVIMGFRKTMHRLGEEYQKSYGELNKHSLQAFQGIKEVIAMRRQQFFVDRFERAFYRQQKALVGQVVAAESPTYIIEGVCVVGFILAVGLRLQNGSDSAEFLPKLAAFAMAAFRILPSMGRITSSFNQVVYFMPSLNKVYENLREVKQLESEEVQEVTALLEDGSEREVTAERTAENAYLEIKDIYWRYPNTEHDVLSGVNIEIRKGMAVALIGHSGAGKTTLADIILGLYKPQRGSVRLEGTDIKMLSGKWSECVGYIPQSVYLTDDTIRSNVAFGIEEPDDAMVWQALEQAQLKELVAGLPDRLDTVIGDRGVRLSGGQRQRIAIARALYYNPPILILDEATSALDTETENAVMDAINSLQGHKTLIIVAHRLSTIQNCDVIYEITGGHAVEKQKEEIFG